MHKPPRENFFDHTRLFAAWLVLFSHHHALLALPEPGHLQFSMGHLGVGIFFSLSGYLVAHSMIADPHAGRFLARRVLRIFPGLAVNVLLCALVLGPWLSSLSLADYLLHPDSYRYFENLLLFPRFNLPQVFAANPHPHAVNGSLWTLPFEFLAYLCLCIMVYMLGIRQLARVSLLVWGLSMTVTLAWHPTEPLVVWGNDLRHVPVFMALFFAGTLLACRGERVLDNPHLLALITAMLIISLMFKEIFLFASLVLLPLLTIYHASRQAPARYAVRHDCSYGIYIYAFPVQQATISFFAHWGFWPTLIMAGALTYLLAWLSWILIERPALRLKPQARRHQDPLPVAT